MKTLVFQWTTLFLYIFALGCNTNNPEPDALTVDSPARPGSQDSESLQEKMEHLYPIVGVKLKSRRGHVFDLENVDEYSLDLLTDTNDDDFFVNSFGQFIQFNENEFTAHNSTMCGNDVNIVTKGTWRWVADRQIEVFVESIQRNEYCSKPSEKPQKILGVFELTWSGDEKNLLNLVRVK